MNVNKELKQLLASRQDIESPLCKEIWDKFKYSQDIHLTNWLIDQIAKTRKPNLVEVLSDEPFRFEDKLFQIKTFNGKPILFNSNDL